MGCSGLSVAGDAALTRLMSLPNTGHGPASTSPSLWAAQGSQAPTQSQSREREELSSVTITSRLEPALGAAGWQSWPRPQPFLSISSLFVVAAPAPASVLARSRHPSLRSRPRLDSTQPRQYRYRAHTVISSIGLCISNVWPLMWAVDQSQPGRWETWGGGVGHHPHQTPVTSGDVWPMVTSTTITNTDQTGLCRLFRLKESF